jgi:hypothetical protein
MKFGFREMNVLEYYQQQQQHQGVVDQDHIFHNQSDLNNHLIQIGVPKLSRFVLKVQGAN